MKRCLGFRAGNAPALRFVTITSPAGVPPGAVALPWRFCRGLLISALDALFHGYVRCILEW